MAEYSPNKQRHLCMFVLLKTQEQFLSSQEDRDLTWPSHLLDGGKQKSGQSVHMSSTFRYLFLWLFSSFLTLLPVCSLWPCPAAQSKLIWAKSADIWSLQKHVLKLCKMSEKADIRVAFSWVGRCKQRAKGLESVLLPASPHATCTADHVAGNPPRAAWQLLCKIQLHPALKY